LVAGDGWLVVGGWWLVAGGWWLVVGDGCSLLSSLPPSNFLLTAWDAVSCLQSSGDEGSHNRTHDQHGNYHVGAVHADPIGEGAEELWRQ
jgi:hypothetical protein